MTQEPYQRMLQGYLRGELRALNAHLPAEQKPLSWLLTQEYPGVTCKDGNTYLFKGKELRLLADILNSEEQAALLLPLLIEVSAGEDEVAVISRGGVEEKVLSRILNMPLDVKHNRIKMYKPQLALIRKMLRTTTQYVFAPKLIGESISAD
jgi:uncharacterized protein (UPF0216 family)